MKKFEANFQIGKQGLSQALIESINTALKTHRQARISVLKSATREKSKLKEMALEIQSKIPKKTALRILGYTRIIRVLSDKLKPTSKV